MLSFFKNCLLICLLCVFNATVNAQSYASYLKQYAGSKLHELSYPDEVNRFYKSNDYSFSWFEDGGRNIDLLRSFINHCEDYGLNRNDYYPLLFAPGKSASIGVLLHDSISADVTYTDAAIHFLHDLLAGNRADLLSYNGLEYKATCHDIPGLLSRYLSANTFAYIIDELEPKDPAYLSAKRLIITFRKNMAADGFKDASVVSLNADSQNKALLKRLYQLGIIASDTIKLPGAELRSAIRQVQKLFGLLADGNLRTTTLAALNTPLNKRIAELQSMINCYRWLSCIRRSNHIIVVNIPSASLLLYEHDKIQLESRIIVGKPSTPTPTLSSTITEVVLYPYWNVPYKIATRELLPKFRRSAAYVEANNYQVLDMKGRVVDPAKINWRKFGPGYFPYVIRQSTGCDNALGLIKLNFYNPFSVYLHDTPGKSFFALNKRYLSHGCMRIEKAMETGRYILKDNRIAIDTLEQQGCLRNQAPIVVPASEKIPVMVLYHTAWPDSTGYVRFYEDIYHKNAAVKNK